MSDTIPGNENHPDSKNIDLELTAPSVIDLIPESPGSRVTESPVRGEKFFLFFEKLFLLFDRLCSRGLPRELNPFLQTGAIAMVSLLIATVTGVFLLFWYSPSVVKAFPSVQSMEAAAWTGGLIRSLHRYSSDLCLFFSLVHAIRLFFERRFTGARWLAWITGIVMVAIIWIIGWTGYWLVWDTRAQHVAVGTAKLLDVLPIFADPMGRTLLVNETVNSLLFFVIFFIHMMIPLVFGVATWLHLSRISRPRFLTGKLLSYWMAGVLLLLSIFFPATASGPAEMTAVGQSFTMDAWYLFPIALMDRLSAGALWGILLIGSFLVFSIPWLLSRKRPESARVIVSRCDACTKCYVDCPYNAITMVARTDGQEDKIPTQARVDPNLCVGCGICAGSCDTAGNGLPSFDVIEIRKMMRGWIGEMADAGEDPFIALICENSAGIDLKVDSQSGVCDKLPGYRVLKIPCSGWIQPLTLEGLVRKGAKGVLIVSCGPGECRYREGAEWTRQRLEGERAPALREDHADRDKILLLGLNKTCRKQMIDHASAFQSGKPVLDKMDPSKAMIGFSATVMGLFVACIIALGSAVPYAAPAEDAPSLVVTFRHPGQVSEIVKFRTPEELEAMPVHMRQAEIRERRRMNVRLRVRIDGQVVWEESYLPKGIWADGPSVAMEAVSIEPGSHKIEVAVGDGADVSEWQFVDEKVVEFTKKNRRVIIFDRVNGFSWH